MAADFPVSHEVVAYGVGISVVFFFFRYAVDTMPKSIAWAGVIAGLIIAVADQIMPGIKLTLPSIGLFLIGALFIGAAVHLAFAQSNHSPPGASPQQPNVPQSDAPSSTGIKVICPENADPSRFQGNQIIVGTMKGFNTAVDMNCGKDNDVRIHSMER
jgi:hypothetical protein